VQINLDGGYYDAGDNLKLGFPMAFTITMLSWSTIEFKDKLRKNNELTNALESIKWGTDYLMKAHPHPNILYGEIGDPDSDHQCWQRPEDMSTPRDSYRIDEQHPGSDLAAETAAALAAASIAFQYVDKEYASRMLTHATQVWFYFLSYHYYMQIINFYSIWVLKKKKLFICYFYLLESNTMFTTLTHTTYHLSIRCVKYLINIFNK